ncbi:glycosyltransferase family 4 protein [Paenibacillus cucumis (ex Kampfer et al. 2016)]|uniref:Glycosyltransferase family 4 protein n=1 Tax=Paenibacillus cucumis (ex Kampfer et al. 2016) TaxID=1776858 RepID=A0ABS7KRT9_9BACL|nr:glycosyltransferase family 4 protein [Paenibacillus cucumis (ex Kampfer et al. 2016)]MBY0206803.1 glycosyltransferase family 4 protein [Paenibacillus cucumis (ex Kampfer et al. 2016)]
MRLALISHTSALAGAERMLLNMANYLSKCSENVEVFIFAHGNGPLEKQCELMGLNYIKLDNTLPWYLFVKDNLSELTEHWKNVNVSKEELKQYFLNLGIECVVINTLTNLPGILASNELKIPSVLWIHGIIDSMTLGNESQFKLTCDHVLIGGASKIICPSNWVKEHYEFYRSDITVIPNFTEVPSSFTPFPAKDSFVFSCLNTWNSIKGIDLLIEAASILKQRGRSFVLNLYGDGPDELYFKNLVVEKNLDEIVTFNPRVSDVSSIYYNSHALITASLVESFGMTLIEAMAHGRPVIASKVGGHVDIIMDMENGIFSKSVNPLSFAEQMEWALDNIDKLEIIGMNAYEFVREKYSEERVATTFIEIVKHSLNSEKGFDLKIPFVTMIEMFNLTLGSPLELSGENTDVLVQVVEPLMVGSPQMPVKIKSFKTYELISPIENMDKIEFFIGTHSKPVAGELVLKICYNGISIRESSVRLEDVKDNSWVPFTFSSIKNLANKKISFLLTLISNDEISIYEDVQKTKMNRILSKFRRSGIICCRIQA